MFVCRVLAVLLTLVVMAGCARSKKTITYETVDKQSRRDTEKAKAENAKALKFMEAGRYDEAIEALKRGLAADVMYGPAHNNLGKAYYHKRDYYLAAWEFEYAAKLMTHQPEPRNNLGLVFEAVGKLDEAVEQYEEALKAAPDNPQFIGNAVRAKLRRGDRGEDVRELLEQLVMRDTRPEWIQWAEQRLVLLNRAPATAPTTQY